MQYRLIGLAPLLAVMASTAFAAGPDDILQNPQPRTASSHCDTNGAQDLVFNAACNSAQKPVRVVAEIVQPKARLRPANAKRITRMPWQTGIFQ